MVNQTPAMDPLISIIIITYNSANYVLETLESAKAQTYRNIEVVASDDGSTDETVSLCEEWLLKNKDHIMRTEMITVTKNTGIPANCNRGVKAARGEWVKIIAGDDILDEKCIELNIEFTRKKGFPKIIVVSNMIRFVDKQEFHKNGQVVTPSNIFLLKEGVDPSIQHKYVIREYLGNTPTLFIKKEILVDVEFDERFPFNEDRPFAINATKKGYVFHYLNATTVYYRISEHSVFASKSSDVLFNDFYLKRRPFVIEYIYPHISVIEKFLSDLEFQRLKVIDKLGFNKNNLPGKLINFLSYKMSPYRYFRKFQIKKQSKEEYWKKMLSKS